MRESLPRTCMSMAGRGITELLCSGFMFRCSGSSQRSPPQARPIKLHQSHKAQVANMPVARHVWNKTDKDDNTDSRQSGVRTKSSHPLHNHRTSSAWLPGGSIIDISLLPTCFAKSTCVCFLATAPDSMLPEHMRSTAGHQKHTTPPSMNLSVPRLSRTCPWLCLTSHLRLLQFPGYLMLGPIPKLLPLAQLVRLLVVLHAAVFVAHGGMETQP